MAEKKGCQYIRITPDNEDFDGHKALYEMFRHIEQLPKKAVIKKISKRLLTLGFKSGNEIKSKAVNIYRYEDITQLPNYYPIV